MLVATAAAMARGSLGGGGGAAASAGRPLLLLPQWLTLSRRLSHARAAQPSPAEHRQQGQQHAPPLAHDTTTTTTPTNNNNARVGRRADRAALEDAASASLLPTIAVLGRPNVGKSALFNRLTAGRDALVADTPGPGGHTTRDWREGYGKLADLRFRLVDTSGLEPTVAMGAAGRGAAAAALPPLQARSAAITARVLARSHVALLVLDASAGVTEADLDLGRWLRRQRALWRRQWRLEEGGGGGGGNGGGRDLLPVAGPCGPATILVLNKAEVRGARQRMPATLVDLHANLGLLLPREEDDDENEAALTAAAAAAASSAAADDDRVVALSARSGEGLADLYVALRPHVEAAAAALREAEDHQRLQQQHVVPASPLLWPPPLPPPPLQPPSAADNADAASRRPDPSLLPDWPDPEEDGPMRVAIMGLPNAGKSTLLNALLGTERAMTGPEPGLTRDAPTAWLAWRGGLRVELTDTAGWVPRSDRAEVLAAADVVGGSSGTRGLRRGGASGGGGGGGGGGGAAAVAAAAAERGEAQRLAEQALARGRRAMDAAHVVVLLLDAARLDRDGRLISKAELGLAAEAVRAGKALVVALNKADLLQQQQPKGGGGGGGAAAAGATARGAAAAAEAAAAASPSSCSSSSSSLSSSSWPEASKMARELADALDARFAEAGKPAVVALSALEAAATGAAVSGSGLDIIIDSARARAGAAAVLDACAVSYARWTRRASTSSVRRALDRVAARLAGTPAGQAVARVKWGVQAKARPPTFSLALRGGAPLAGGGERFLASALREGLGLEGVPVRVSVRYNAREREAVVGERGGKNKGGSGGGGGGNGKRRRARA
jgi:predicted GTPase